VKETLLFSKDISGSLYAKLEKFETQQSPAAETLVRVIDC